MEHTKKFFACFTQILITETWIFFSQTAACYLLGCIPRTACMLSLTMCTDSIPLAPCIDKAPYYVQDSVHAFFLTCAQVTQHVFQMKIIEPFLLRQKTIRHVAYGNTKLLFKHCTSNQFCPVRSTFSRTATELFEFMEETMTF